MMGRGFPGGASDKDPACQCKRHKRCEFDPWVWKIPWRREWQPAPIFLPGESHGQRSLAGYSPWCPKESDTTEWLSTLCCVIWFLESFLRFLVDREQIIKSTHINNLSIFQLIYKTHRDRCLNLSSSKEVIISELAFRNLVAQIFFF